MKCPHCRVEYHAKPNQTTLLWSSERLSHPDGGCFMCVTHKCSACNRAIIFLDRGIADGPVVVPSGTPLLVYPKAASRPPTPSEVPPAIGEDYKEACLILTDSPKASAALSRRCLQHVLRAAGFDQKDLAPQIDAAMKTLPGYLSPMLHELREIGNFAAHPTKSTNSGEIIPVLPQEAEMMLEVLEMVFDHFYTKPAEAKRRRDAINAKLAEAGKKPLP